MSEQTEKRKHEHVLAVLENDVQYDFGPGFSDFYLVHNSLPELDFGDVDLSCRFLGKKLSAPLMICAITGGYSKAETANKKLAVAAEKYGIAFGLGSQRAMLESPELKKTYDVRKEAPEVTLISNIGAAQLKKYPIEKIESLVSSIESDALAIHLNPLQEIIQHEGDHDFSGALKSIEKVCDRISVPVIVKETGAGINSKVAKKLKKAGVSWIDVAGAGGTSWSKVEYARSGSVKGFENWGIPTVDSLAMCNGVLPLIASGGVRSGIDAVKSLVLGADMAGAAYPFLKAYAEGELENTLEEWVNQMKISAFLTGCKNIRELKKAEICGTY